MSSPLTGKFHIVSSVDPSQPIGADIDGSSEQKPVITEGKMIVVSQLVFVHRQHCPHYLFGSRGLLCFPMIV